MRCQALAYTMGTNGLAVPNGQDMKRVSDEMIEDASRVRGYILTDYG